MLENINQLITDALFLKTYLKIKLIKILICMNQSVQMIGRVIIPIVRNCFVFVSFES